MILVMGIGNVMGLGAHEKTSYIQNYSTKLVMHF